MEIDKLNLLVNNLSQEIEKEEIKFLFIGLENEKKISIYKNTTEEKIAEMIFYTLKQNKSLSNEFLKICEKNEDELIEIMK